MKPKITFINKPQVDQSIQYPGVFKENGSNLIMLGFSSSCGISLTPKDREEHGRIYQNCTPFHYSSIWTYLGPADITVKIAE